MFTWEQQKFSQLNNDTTALCDRAIKADGQHPFTDQTLIDLAAGKRSACVAHKDDVPVAVGITNGSELEYVVDPIHRNHGVGNCMMRTMLAQYPNLVFAWAHGDHPASQKIAKKYHFSVVRKVLQLQRTLAGYPDEKHLPEQQKHSTLHFDHFRPGHDESEWLRLNAEIFIEHAEQGQLTLNDLQARMHEPWFKKEDFLLVRDQNNVMVGYNWLKRAPKNSLPLETSAEIYALGVHPSQAGRGLGRKLMFYGLNRLKALKCTHATLYVEAENTTALNLYHTLGFSPHTVDVQYRHIREA